MGKSKKSNTFSSGLQNTLEARILVRSGKLHSKKGLVIEKQVQRKMLKKGRNS